LTNASSSLKEHLSALPAAVLNGLKRGIEKESLRVRPDGALALTPHPAALGSALKHPHITTDFSEALIELITGVHAKVEACREELKRIHQFVYRRIGDEVLWGASMPCSCPDENAIPIARYGNSNVGRAKTVYRIGLAHRYGKRMQMIAGLHYNWSLPEAAWPLAGHRDANEAYFALVRNFRRHAWLLLYLFGASPAVCASFVAGRKHALEELAPGTLYLPHATSLRMGRLGYLSEAQDSLAVSYNSIESYTVASTRCSPNPTRRTKRSASATAKATTASWERASCRSKTSSTAPSAEARHPPGRAPAARAARARVEYVEVRAMDLDPFSPIGITADTIRFLDVFLLHCLLTGARRTRAGRSRPSGTTSCAPRRAAASRDCAWTATARWSSCANGRGGARRMRAIAAALDEAQGTGAHREALSAAVKATEDPGLLPSARVLAEMRERHENSYSRFALALSLEHAKTLRSEPLPAEVEARFARLAEESIRKQKEIEASERVDFETYRQKYLSPESLRV